MIRETKGFFESILDLYFGLLKFIFVESLCEVIVGETEVELVGYIVGGNKRPREIKNDS